MLLEGFKAEFQGRLREELQDSELARITGLNPGEFLVDRFSASYEIDTRTVKLQEAAIRTPHFRALLTATVFLDRRRREAPPIQARLVISGLSQQAESVI